ncbi:MAG: hypothetical protein Q9190_004896, partial [Brigantiaea leucoxantha]
MSNSRKFIKQNPSIVSKSTSPVFSVPPKGSSSKLQARGATYEKTDNEDLLDFLRQGPTEDRENHKRLAPGSGATVVPPNPRSPNSYKDNARSSVASTQNSSLANTSIRSANSRTGLLDNPRGAYSVSPSSPQAPRRDDPPPPVRRQYRAKDPYAIDTDSDEDEDYPSTPKPRAQEESLIDFLNSSPPYEKQPPIPSTSYAPKVEPTFRNHRTPAVSSSSSSKPILGTTPGIRSASTSNNSASAPLPTTTTIGNTNYNNNNNNNHYPPSSSKKLPDSSSRSRRADPLPSAPQLPPLNPRSTSPHLISTIGTKFDTYKPTQPTYAAHVDRERNGRTSSFGRVVNGTTTRSDGHQDGTINGMASAGGAIGLAGKNNNKKKMAPRGERDGGGGGA